ncbi:MAG: response regulator, partial [Planctomycetota bacterium]
QRFGLTPDTAENGQEAVKRIKEGEYDLVLMDCSMPVLDGYEATRQIRAEESEDRHTPIVAMTAHAMKGDREKCLASGMDDYITKPLTRHTLHKILHQYCSAVHEVHAPTTPRILIAEDDNMIRKVVVRWLSRALPDAHLREAEDGVQACTLLGSFLPDVLLLDLTMPNVDGVAVIRRIREEERYRQIRIIVLTALPFDDERVKTAKELGADTVLDKAVSMETIEEAVRKVLTTDYKPPADNNRAPLANQTFNPNQLEEILPGNCEGQERIIEAAMSSIDATLSQYAESLKEGDLEEARRQAHALKGAALNIGAERLAAAALKAEEASGENDLQDELTQAHQDLLAALKGR